MKKSLFVSFLNEIIFAPEGAGTATGEAKIITNGDIPDIESDFIASYYASCPFTTDQGVRYNKDGYYGK